MVKPVDQGGLGWGTLWGSVALFALLVVLVIFGGTQIPKLARSLGQAQKEFKTGLEEGAKDDGKDGEKGQ